MSACWQLSAVDLSHCYREGSLSPVDVLEACLARLDTVNPKLNAVIAQRDRSLLRDEARASTQRHARGEALSALDGVPLTVKDNLLTADLPTTWGSLGGRDHRSAHDELAVARARTAGALFIGKTNVPEFTLEGYTANRLFGVTRNPWDTALTPGGSSGGAVAAVAAGIAPLALGTDGGGSIRRPASHCGVVGLKPSIGAVPREHTLPSLLLDFEVVGPIARSVADVALLYRVLHGAPDTEHAPRPLRVLYVPTLDGAPVDAEIAERCAQAAHGLAALGHTVTEGDIPLDLGVMSMWPQIGQIGLAQLFNEDPSWREGAAPKYRAMAEEGAALPATRLWAIVEAVQQLRRDAARLFRDIDVLVTPAAAALPWPAEEAFPPRIAGHSVGPRGHAVFTGWINAAGLPALALPAQPSSLGLPIGIQLVGAHGAENLLLALGADVETMAPWRNRWPPL